ncbi:Bifunctional inhibitor/plant lipid transfer protein/seed storage helical domain [Sesbania bispinosa]|nr:Bifunctional inhibitor/plant lipid transfer protein/seed storage helical domain [Sesbania bispinosa]
MECLPYLLEDQSQPDDLCCSAIESVVSIDPECICEMMGSDNMPLDLKKALALPTICGLRLPCNVHASPAPSPGMSIVLLFDLILQ